MSKENPFSSSDTPVVPEKNVPSSVDEAALHEKDKTLELMAKEGEEIKDLLSRIVENGKSLKGVVFNDKDYGRIFEDPQFGLIEVKDAFSKIYMDDGGNYSKLINYSTGHTTNALAEIVSILGNSELQEPESEKMKLILSKIGGCVIDFNYVVGANPFTSPFYYARRFDPLKDLFTEKPVQFVRKYNQVKLKLIDAILIYLKNVVGGGELRAPLDNDLKLVDESFSSSRGFMVFGNNYSEKLTQIISATGTGKETMLEYLKLPGELEKKYSEGQYEFYQKGPIIDYVVDEGMHFLEGLEKVLDKLRAEMSESSG